MKNKPTAIKLIAFAFLLLLIPFAYATYIDGFSQLRLRGEL